MPEHYQAHMDAFQFIKDVPVEWSESRYLYAEPGDYIVIARKAKTSDKADSAAQDGNSESVRVTSAEDGAWYVGGVTDGNARSLEVSLDFLEPGRKYFARIYSDAQDTDYQTNPETYTISEKKVTSRTVLKMKMARGGGFAISIVPQQ